MAERRDPGRAMLARLELEVRRDHPMTHEELVAVRAAVRGGRAAPPPLRVPAHALAAATLRSSDRGIAHPWLVYGLVVLALLNAGRAVRDLDAPWAIPMAVLYAALAGAAWLGRRFREQRARAALDANATTGFPPDGAAGTGPAPSGRGPDPGPGSPPGSPSGGEPDPNG